MSCECGINAGTCVGPTPSFRGSFWGCVGKYLTRLPEYVHSTDELQQPRQGDPYYPYPKFRRHPTLSVELPNLTDGDGVERECFGAACSMIADLAGYNMTGSRPQYCWWWLHYVPVGEQTLDNAVAALAVAQVGTFTEGTMTAELGTPTVWLVNDANGDPEVWDSYDKLDIYNDDKKAFVGASNLGWFEKRLTGGTQNRITFYSIGVATPTVQTYTNYAYVHDAESFWGVVDVSRNSFPHALGCKVETTTFGDASLASVDRVFMLGIVNTSNGRIEKPPGIDDDTWDVLTSASLSNSCMAFYGLAGAERESTSSPTITETRSQVIIRSWECGGSTKWEAPTPGAELSPIKILVDACLFNGADYDDRVLPDVGSLPGWICRATCTSPTWTYDNSGSLAVPVGWDGPPYKPGTNVRAAHVFRFLPVHGGWNTDEFGQQHFLAVASGDELQQPGVLYKPSGADTTEDVSYGYIDTSSEDVFVGVDVLEGMTDNYGGVKAVLCAVSDRDDPRINVGLIRVALDHQSGADPTPEYRIIAVQYPVKYEPNTYVISPGNGLEPATEDYLPHPWKWSNSKSQGGESLERAYGWTFGVMGVSPTDIVSVTPFYDASDPCGEGVLQVMPAPSGFFKDTAGVVRRGSFAIAGALDTAHPSRLSIRDPTVSGY